MTPAWTVMAAAAALLICAGESRAQVCAKLNPGRIECRYDNPAGEGLTVSAQARLQHLSGPVNGALRLTLDGRPCLSDPARWQLGAGYLRASCQQRRDGLLRHDAVAELYGVQGARVVALQIDVQPSAGGLERLPLDAGQLAPAPPRRVRRGLLGRLWPF